MGLYPYTVIGYLDHLQHSLALIASTVKRYVSLRAVTPEEAAANEPSADISIRSYLVESVLINRLPSLMIILTASSAVGRPVKRARSSSNRLTTRLSRSTTVMEFDWCFTARRRCLPPPSPIISTSGLLTTE